MLTNILFFFIGLLGIFFHIVAKLKYKGFNRFAEVWRYIRENQLTVAFSIFTYLAIYILWNSGYLKKIFPEILWFNSDVQWLAILIAYFSDSLWRNIARNIEEAQKRNGKG